MSATPVQTETTDPDLQPASPSASSCGCPCTKWLPVLLLAAAAGLYGRDLWKARQRTEAANQVRRQVAVPLGGVAVSHKLEGRSIPFIVHCPVPVASNLLHAIARAEPTRFPKGEVEGEEFEIHLIQTNATATILRAVRLANVPDALFVGVKSPSEKDGNGTPQSWQVSAPAKVPEAGMIVGGILESIRKAADKLPPDEELVSSMTNAVAKRATAPTSNTSEASAPGANAPATAEGTEAP